MDSSSLVEQGIAAYRAGNKDEAVRLLSQALRENRDDETAWLYLGAAIDDPDKKRQAFERVLQINPNNEKARNALARIGAGTADAAANMRSTAETGGASAYQAPSQPPQPPKVKNTPLSSAMSGEGFAVPFQVEGAPARVTIPYIIDNAKRRIDQAVKIYTNRDYDLYLSEARGASMWDSVFIAGVGVVAVGAAELLGRWIGWPLTAFSGGLGGLIWPIFAAIVAMASTAGGFALGVAASKSYLNSQNINVSLPQHSMYYALIFLPLVLVSAVLTFVTHALGFLNCILFPLTILASLAMVIYGWVLLKGAFDRVYGTDNNRGLITSALAVAGWIGGAIIAGIIGGIFSGIVGAIFRFPFRY